MLQALLMVSPPSKRYTVSTLLFHIYGGSNVAVKDGKSHFYIFVPIKAAVKLDHGNTGH